MFLIVIFMYLCTGIKKKESFWNALHYLDESNSPGGLLSGEHQLCKG